MDARAAWAMVVTERGAAERGTAERAGCVAEDKAWAGAMETRAAAKVKTVMGPEAAAPTAEMAA